MQYCKQGRQKCLAFQPCQLRSAPDCNIIPARKEKGTFITETHCQNWNRSHLKPWTGFVTISNYHFNYSSTSLFRISKTAAALFFKNNVFKRSPDDHSNHSYTGMSAQICTRMPTYIKCSTFKSWNPAEDGKTRSFTEQDVVPEGFSNIWKWIFSKRSGESPKCGVPLGDFVWALFPFLSSLLNGSEKTLHRFFRKHPSCRPK